MSTNLKQTEAMFDSLDREEQAEFCEYIAPRFILPSRQKKLNREQTIAAWKRIKQLALEDAGQPSEGPSALEVLSEMRNSRY